MNGLGPNRLLGIFAHPDDEIFCVGGTFALAAAEGAETKVVSFTRGEAGAIRHADIATRATLGSTRERELASACAALGIQHSECLEFADGGLVDTNREQLVEAAVRSIREFRPDQVYSFDQTGAYGHPDHIVMSEVSIEACHLAGDPGAFPDAGVPFTPTELLHARFPQNDRLLLRLLVDWLVSHDARFCGSDEFANALMMFADGTSMLGYASDHLSVEWFPKGSYIIEQGERASNLNLVLSGSVDIIAEDSDSKRTHIGSAGPGEFVGEQGIATNNVRNAHCVAAENTACFVLSPEARSYHAPRGTTTNSELDLSSKPTGSALPVDIEHDVEAAVDKKVYGLAAHSSQYAMAPGLFPQEMLSQLLGTEYFFRAWSTHEAGRENQ